MNNLSSLSRRGVLRSNNPLWILVHIQQLAVSVVNPLLMSFFEDYVGGILSHDDFVSMLRATESYLFRRSVCDVATDSLNKFFSSVIARLNVVRDDGGNIREAFEAILLGEEGTARRMPSDAEFERALRTRDCYAFKRGFYLLTALENSWHAKDPLDFSGDNFSIVHIMPQNALASAEWREMLGDDCERVYEELINTLGNLTLTAYNSELSDAPFAEKKAHLKGGFNQDYLVISKELHDLEKWDEEAICARAERLAECALEVWTFPERGAAGMCDLGHDVELSAPIERTLRRLRDSTGGDTRRSLGVSVGSEWAWPNTGIWRNLYNY